jgi:hypothetical protein
MEERRQHDLAKAQICKENGISLIEVPFWWDRRQESLAATIHSQRPDLFPNDFPVGKPIPLVEPTTQIKERTDAESKVFYIIFLLCLVTMRKGFMTAKDWEMAEDPTGW